METIEENPTLQQQVEQNQIKKPKAFVERM